MTLISLIEDDWSFFDVNYLDLTIAFLGGAIVWGLIFFIFYWTLYLEDYGSAATYKKEKLYLMVGDFLVFLNFLFWPALFFSEKHIQLNCPGVKGGIVTGIFGYDYR